jgi:phosphinothricin acetyltransferase
MVEDALMICGIYNPYIKESTITFEEIPVSVKEMQERIRTTGGEYPWLVWEEAGAILAYAYVHRWQVRSAYRFTVEDSIYVKQDREGQGFGGKLLEAILDETRKIGIHAVIAGITLPNERSIALHERFGFKKVAQFDEVGFKFGKRLNVGYWELMLGTVHGS